MCSTCPMWSWGKEPVYSPLIYHIYFFTRSSRISYKIFHQLADRQHYWLTIETSWASSYRAPMVLRRAIFEGMREEVLELFEPHKRFGSTTLAWYSIWNTKSTLPRWHAVSTSALICWYPNVGHWKNKVDKMLSKRAAVYVITINWVIPVVSTSKKD